MRTTIKDIAKRTGFSVTTVSLVMNNKAIKIPDKTRNIILDTAKEMGYRPNQLAVSMITKRTKTIGLIISDVSNVFFAKLTKVIEERCLALGWNLILCDTNDSHSRELKYIEMLTDKGVDGIIFGASYEMIESKEIETVSLLHKSRVPFVLVDRYINNCCCPCFLVDNVLGGYIATKHLCENGHKDIAVITGPMNLRECKDRLDGYKKALSEYGIKLNEELIFNGDFSSKSGKNAVEYFKGKKFTAVFAFNDVMALGAYHNLKGTNADVPQKVSVIGFDDVFEQEIINVPLTSVHQPIEKMGNETVDTLVELIEKNDLKNEQIHIFRPTLSQRGTTGKVE